MAFCPNCGSEFTDGTAFCPTCGAGQTPTTGVVPEASTYQGGFNQTQTGTLPKSAQILGLISMICGLVSLVSCYGGFVPAIAALILSHIANKQAPGVPNSKAKLGKTTGIIGIVVSAVCLIGYIVMVALTAAFATEHSYDFNY